MNAAPSRRLLRVLAINLLVLVGIYGAAELLYSSWRYAFPAPDSLWVFEDVGRTMQFDPVRGYRLTATPSRFTRITQGQIEYIGTFRGNAQGFPDRDDFGPARTAAHTPRYAVFGDSFTAGQYLAENWPDRVEDMVRRNGGRLELLNFSVDGGGLANWASILQAIVQAQRYELDGLVFAVCCNDLDRPFAFTDNRGRSRYAFAYAPGWDAASQPQALDARAQALLQASEKPSSIIVDSAGFDEVLKGRVPPPASRWRFELTGMLRSLAGQYRRRWQQAADPPPLFEDGQLRLIAGIHAFVRERRLPVTVVFIGDRDDTLQREDHRHVRQAREFARLLGADFVDGRHAFDGVDEARLRQLWLPFDGHWGLGGSDVFAAYMVRELTQRPPPSRP